MLVNHFMLFASVRNKSEFDIKLIQAHSSKVNKLSLPSSSKELGMVSFRLLSGQWSIFVLEIELVVVELLEERLTIEKRFGVPLKIARYWRNAISKGIGVEEFIVR